MAESDRHLLRPDGHPRGVDHRSPGTAITTTAKLSTLVAEVGELLKKDPVSEVKGPRKSRRRRTERFVGRPAFSRGKRGPLRTSGTR